MELKITKEMGDLLVYYRGLPSLLDGRVTPISIEEIGGKNKEEFSKNFLSIQKDIGADIISIEPNYYADKDIYIFYKLNEISNNSSNLSGKEFSEVRLYKENDYTSIFNHTIPVCRKLISFNEDKSNLISNIISNPPSLNEKLKCLALEEAKKLGTPVVLTLGTLEKQLEDKTYKVVGAYEFHKMKDYTK